MPPTSRDPAQFLKSLGDRVKPATEHFRSAQSNASGKKAAPSLAELIPHAEELTSNGRSCTRISTSADFSGRRSEHGYVCPAAGMEVESPGEALALLARDPAFRDVDPEKMAFVDIETTSLSGGSGTYAFLIGVGRFEGAGFRVNQFFMEDYAEEEALVDLVSEELSDAEALVTYNGKCFDVPIMETRWRMNRRRPDYPKLHLDLLYPSRRLWRLRCTDCRLGTIEREVLGVMRVSDIESAWIPQTYFDYLQGHDRDQMLRVVDHHAQDIFSLGALLRTLSWAVTHPDDARFADPGEQWGLARIFQSAGREAEMVAALERAIVLTRDEDLGFRLSMHLAHRLKRIGREGEAVEIWRARAPQARPDRLEPLVELAKHAEHRLKDFNEARRWTERALEIAQGDEELRSWIEGMEQTRTRSAGLEALEHRLKRIRSKQNRRDRTARGKGD